MARPRLIDREDLLARVEQAVAGAGVQALTFGALAQATGTPKATLQSMFGSRDALLGALLERGLQREQARFEALAGPEPEPEPRLRAHILSTEQESAEDSARRVALLVALASATSGPGDSVQAWYRARAGDLSVSTPQERRRRLALLATEGAFFMRCFAPGLVDDSTWQDIFADLLACVGDSNPDTA